MKIKYWITVAFIVGIVSLAMPVTACAYNHNPIFASYLNGCAFGCTSAQDGDADYSTTYSYDLQGNILSLTRQGMTAPGFYFCIDDIQATFNGNQLSSLSDDALTVLLESSLDL